MIANNIFRAIANFFTNFVFAPLEAIRFTDNWWIQNTFSWILIAITFVAFYYWMGELKKHRNTPNE